jgi:hypothetical protein
MSKISIYEVVPVPKLADRLIGTSVGGQIEDVTYNFTLSELLNLFIPNIPANGLQGVLDIGNTATQDIDLFGTITTTYLDVTDTANLFITYLNQETHIVGSVYDSLDLLGAAGAVLTSTGSGVQWVTLPPIFTPNLQQVLTVGNTANLDIILSANIVALDINTDTETVNNNITIDGTITDGYSSVGTLNQVLSSTGTEVKWVNLPVYSATSPLLFNSVTGVFSIQQAGSTQNGYLSSSDWITFDGKQNAGNYITALTGEATASGPGSASIILNNSSVIAKVLTGLNITGGSISAADSILTAFGKVQGQLNGLVGGVFFKGSWNALINNPTLTSSVGTQGWYYIVSVAGNTNLNGITDWQVGDWAIFNGATWDKIDNTDSVTSVNGQIGAVSLTTDNIPEGATNLYYLDSRARAAISLTTIGTSGAATYNNVTGVLNIPAYIGGVISFNGRTGVVVPTEGDYTLTELGDVTITAPITGQVLKYNGAIWINDTDANTGTVTSVSFTLGSSGTDLNSSVTNSTTTPLITLNVPTASASSRGALSSADWTTFNSKQNALSGTGLVKSTSGTITYITDNSSNWNTAYNDSIVSAAVTGTATKTLTLNQQDGGTITASWSDIDTGLTSVGVSMPSAFSVANSPLTSNGTIAVTGAGTASQYIRGDGQLATLPTGGGGGSSVSYYLNGGTSQGTIGGNPYEEMSRTAVVGTNTDFNINTNGYVANFVTDAGDPALLQIPGGNWNFELFFSASSNGGTPSYYVELYKYDGAVLTLIASNSANPEGITGGTSIDLYLTALAVPQTSLTITDRLAIRVYVNNSGRTITLHTQGTHLCQVITTFSTGIVAINGLTEQVQYFATGTAGVDFAINSLTNTHTFNLPTASATNRGALSSADWTTFNNKANALSGTLNTVPKFTSASTIGDSNIKDNGSAVTVNATAGSFGALQVGNYNGSILMNTTSSSGGLIFQNTSSSNKLWDFSSFGNDINFNESTVGYPVMTLQAGGNVGIKQTNPSYRLDVDGTFHNTGIVTLGNLAGSGSRMVIADSSGVLSTQAITTGTVTAVTASSPLFSSGGNTPNITIQQSSGSQDGYLSSTDWTTFNNKQASGNYITSLTGEATGSGPGAATVTLNNAAVTGKILTGINITGGTVLDTDSILIGFGKLQNQVNGLVGGSTYQGTWNANTNTPTLTSSVGTAGYYYIVSVAGNTNLNGITDWQVGDWAIFNGGVWQKVDNTDAVVSVNGQTGAVSLTTDNIPEGTTNLYYLDSRARAALSFAAGSGAYSSSTGVITIPTNTSQLTNGANFITLASLNGTSPIVYNNTTGNISINQSGTSSNGYLSSTDWNTFNGKQNALTNPITGTGTVNYLPKFTGTTTIGNSALQDDGLGTLSYSATSSYNANFSLNALTSSSSIITFSQNGIKYFQTGSDASGNYRINSYTGATFNGVALYVPTGTSRVLLGNNVTDNGVSSLQVLGGTYLNGTLQVTGIARFDSTLTNGTYTYTLPSATGTLALTSALTGYVPTSRTLSINGTTYDLSADRSWTISTNPAARNQQTFTATAGQTTFSIAYTVGQLDVYYNGSKLAPAEFTATNGTSFTLVTACFAGDIVDAIAYITGAGVGGSGTINYISKFTGSTTLGQSVIYDNGTNAAIGTTSPNVSGQGVDQRVFTVQGTAGVWGGFEAGSTGNTSAGALNGFYGFTNASLSAGYKLISYIGSWLDGGGVTSGADMRFHTQSNGTANALERMRIFSDGNILMQTGGTFTNAGYKLDVNGTGRFSSNLTALSITTSAYSYLYGLRISGNDVGNTIYQATGSLGISTGSSSITFNPSLTTALTLASTGAATFSSSVMVNNSTVSTEGLSVQYNQAKTYTTQTAVSRWHSNESSGSQFKLNLFAIGNATSSSRIFKFQTSNEGVANDGVLSFQADGGNVGIGTTSPSELLDVRNSYREPTSGEFTQILASTTTQDAGRGGSLGFGGFTNGTSGYTTFSGIKGFKENGDGGNTAGTLAFYTRVNSGAITERMRITSGGNVLVGKTTTTPRLAGATIEAEGTIYSGGSQGGYFFEDRSNSTYWYGWYSTGNTNVFFYNGNAGANIASISPATGVYTPLSDINKKKGFELSTIGLNAILGLKPTLYRMKSENDSTDKHLGFIAQEVKEFIPQAYVESGEGKDKFIGLDYQSITATLVKAVQELSAKIEQLENK